MSISPPLTAPLSGPLSMPMPMPTSTIECSFDTLTASDGALIHFKDWGDGPAVVFSHGWPLSSEAWENQMFFLAARGYRVIAHDRRGHGRSSQPWKGNDMDTYADDLAALMQALELENATLVGHSTGGGEVVRYVGRHGTDRVARVVLIGAVPPLMLRTEANPGGLPLDIFDGIRAAVLADRSQFFKDLSMPFYGYNRPGAVISEGVRDAFWRQGMMASLPACHDCIAQFSETDFTADLGKVDVPVLFIHGSEDQMVPIDASARAAVELVEHGRLLVYETASHGLPTTHKDQLNADLLAFLNEG